MNERTTVQDFFLNLGVVATLYTVVISFLNLTFDVINKVFPDNFGYLPDPYSYGVRLSMASLIIVFPLFLWLSKIVTKAIESNPARRDAAVRKWLVYITLFLSSIAIVIDLIVLLNTFLTGEITARFILKVIAVIVVTGIIFWHYMSEIKGTSSHKKYQIAVYGSSILVLALLVTAFSVFGSPANMRKLRFDDIRTSNIQSIQWQLINYWQQKGALPEKLETLNDPISGFTVPVDPETSKAYGYEKTGKQAFKLCADFNLPSPANTNGTNTNLANYKDGSLSHAAGTVCFDRNVDSDLYPVNPKGVPTLLRGL